MPESKNAVLITGSRAPCALMLARTLHETGFRVYTADSLRPNLCEKSEAVEADFLIPSPRFYPDECVTELNRLVEACGITALIPTCEEIYHLSAARSRLPAELNCFFPPFPMLDLLHNKYTCILLAREVGLRVPATKLLKRRPELDNLNWEDDAFLKRVYSRFSSHVIPLLGSPQQRQAAAREASWEDGNPWIHQQYVRGHSICSYSLCQYGKVIHHTAYTTPYTVGIGAGIYYESVDGAPSLAAVRRLAAATRFTGQLSLDFIENEQGLWLLECNPRATMGVALAAQSAEFAEAWKMAIGRGENRLLSVAFPENTPISPEKQPSPPARGPAPASLPRLSQKQERGRKTVSHFDGQSCVKPMLNAPESIPMTPPGLQRQMFLAMLFYGWKGRSTDRSLRRWAQVLLNTPDVLFSRQDPGVLLRQLRALASYTWRARSLGMSVVPFTTYDIEWNGVTEGIVV